MAQISAENVLSTLKASFPYSEAPGIDRLSNLPKDILDQILVCLPIRVIVRTSILSRKWRYAWSSVPDLIFDRECRLALKEEPGSSSLLSIVDHVLLLRTAPIRLFQISDYLNGYNEHVEKWITYLTRNGIEDLYLQFDRGVQDIYKMSSCLFSCKQLKAFSLCCYELMVPHTFKDYMNLVYIDLKVDSLSEASISHLVSSCPLLETLQLEYENHLTDLKICAAKLKSLRVVGLFNYIFLDGCSQLTGCKIRLLGGNDDNENEFVNNCNLEKVLGCLPLLEELEVGYYFLRFLALGTISHSLVYAFEHLKFVDLHVNFQDCKEISAAFCIFRSSPKLETIIILAYWDDDRVLSSDPCNWADMACVFYQLKTFRINFMNGKPPEIEFLKFVLNNAPILESMYVVINKVAKADENQILKSLLLFHRSSAVAEVIVEQ